MLDRRWHHQIDWLLEQFSQSFKQAKVGLSVFIWSQFLKGHLKLDVTSTQIEVIARYLDEQFNLSSPQ